MHVEGYNDMVLDEAKSLYDKLLKHFTNTIMKSFGVAPSSSNASLSSPKSPSSTFPIISNQVDIYSIEESESNHHNKGDISD